MLMTKREMIDGRDYQSRWVGQGRYERAFRLFE